MWPVLVVDGQNLAYAANMTRPLSTSAGHPTQSIHGFLNMLGAACAKFNPVDTYVTWDTARSQKRIALFPDYKANRDGKKKDPKHVAKMKELDMQIPVIQELLRNLMVKQITSDNLEGDDAIALIVKAFNDTDRSTIIVSGDHDFYQLVDERTSVFNPINNGSKHKLVTLTNFSEVTDGLTPRQYLEYKAMVGDTSDNIPGCKGVGKVTAKNILLSHGSYGAFFGAYMDDPESFGHLARKAYLDAAGFEMAKQLMDLRHPMIDPGADRKVDIGEHNLEAFKWALEALEFKSADSIIKCFQCLWPQ